MLTKVIFLIGALCAQSVCSSHYHGPTALPVVLHNGYLADTHEVAAAKSIHLATLSHQSHAGSYRHQGHYTEQGHHGDLRYHGPVAVPHVLHDGHIADTHEVAAAKAEHYAAVAKARAHGGYNHGSSYSGNYASGYDHYSGSSGTHGSYHGPIAVPHVLHDGHIADTHEVADAKAKHYAAVAKARAHGGYKHGGDYSGDYAVAYGPHHGYSGHASYHGALAKPVVLTSGYLADTHEVTHAKQQHLQILHKASHH